MFQQTIRRSLVRLTCSASLLTFAACGSGGSESSSTPDTPGTGTTPTTTADAGATQPASTEEVVGTFNVMTAASDSQPASTSVAGMVFDGPTPANIAWDLSKSSGGCQLWKARAPFCDPGCSGSDVCVANGKCMSQPKSQDVGTVTLRGLGTADIQLEGIANVYDLPIGLTLPFPPAAEGAEIALTTSAGMYGPLSITSHAVAPLTAPATFAMERGKPMQVTWTAPGKPDVARMRVYVDISHHGGTKGKIECEVADTGSLAIDASLVNGLLDMGVAGFPKTELHRYARGTAAVSKGVVKLEVDASLTRPLAIVGFTSCNTDADCAGKTCQANALCAK
jgi:hypothetical protein